MKDLHEPAASAPWYRHVTYLGRIALKILLWGIFLWFILWVHGALKGSHYATRVYEPLQSHYDVVAVGDSLVEGLGSDQLVGFVGRLEQKLGVPIFNAGKRGDTTADVINRLDQVFAWDPKIVIVIIGGNDAVRMTSTEEITRHLSTLFQSLRERNITVLFAEVTDNVLFSERNKKLQTLAELYDVVYMPGVMQGVFWSLDYKSDILHPNDAGYELMTDRILPYLEQALRDLTPNPSP